MFTTRRNEIDVLRVQQQPQVAEHVLDLAALVEPHAAEHAVGRADPHEHVLDHAGHRVRPVEDRDVAVAEPLLVAQALDLARDEQRLLVLVVPAEGRHQLAGRRLGPELLGLALGVVLDHRVRRGQDVARRPVVLRHHEHGGVGVVALEVEHVLDRRAAPRVDALVGVADDADVAVAARRACSPARTGRGSCPGTRRPAGSGTAPGSSGSTSGCSRNSRTVSVIRSSKSSAPASCLRVS